MIPGPKPSREELIDDIEADYDDLSCRSCLCHCGFPPCSFCVDGGSLSLEEFTELRIDEED